MSEATERVATARTVRGLVSGAPPVAPACGARYGRFRVERVLGEGGMGVVLRAQDPELGRKVALKLLRPELCHPQGHARLVREAQAMARVAHPNVVSVFEVGRAGAQVFVAMELVDGDTLLAWLGAASRPWREVLAMFIAAGRGLVAAHDAGLVHRDFKPDNVLVGRDGRPRVADFGLVSGEVPELAASSEDASCGTPVGTPAYMSPEQWAGRRVDARSDQFAFCVALWEALYGARPFAGTPPDQLAASVRAGAIVAPRRLRRLPSGIEPCLRRGLSRAPEARWPTLAMLLDELARRAARGPRVAAGTRGAALMMAGSALALAFAATLAVVSRGGSAAGPDAPRSSLAEYRGVVCEVLTGEQRDTVARHSTKIGRGSGAADVIRVQELRRSGNTAACSCSCRSSSRRSPQPPA